MKDFRSREEVLGELLHPGPGRIIRLAPPPKRPQPVPDHLMPELAERRNVAGHGVVGEETSDDLRQPASLFGDRPVHPLPQLYLDLLEFVLTRARRDFRLSRKEPRSIRCL